MKLLMECPDCSGRIWYVDGKGEQVQCERCLATGLVEATPAEIMQAHPVCRDCKHIEQQLAIAMGHAWQQCNNYNSPCYCCGVTTTDYCNKWEAKP